jgi:hypothetical protein
MGGLVFIIKISLTEDEYSSISRIEGVKCIKQENERLAIYLEDYEKDAERIGEEAIMRSNDKIELGFRKKKVHD